MSNQVQISIKTTKHIIFLTLLLMVFGTTLELYLIDHYEDRLQQIPIICIAVTLISALLVYFKPSALMCRFYKIVLLLTALSGCFGTFLHLRANYEFELEMTPSLNGWALFVESFSGALPALAPFNMIILALLGYSYITLLNQAK